MPVATKTRLTEKQEQFCAAYFTIGSMTFSNATESARKAGYKGNDNTLRSVGAENLTKPAIIAQKEPIQAETAEKVDCDRDYLIKKTREIVDSPDNERNKISAISLLGDFIGAKRENAPNSERESQLRRRMDSETKKLAAEIAKKLTRKCIDIKVLEERS